MCIFPGNSLHTVLMRDDKIRYLFQIALDSQRSSTETEGQRYIEGCYSVVITHITILLSVLICSFV